MVALLGVQKEDKMEENDPSEKEMVRQLASPSEEGTECRTRRQYSKGRHLSLMSVHSKCKLGFAHHKPLL